MQLRNFGPIRVDQRLYLIAFVVFVVVVIIVTAAAVVVVVVVVVVIVVFVFWGRYSCCS